MVIFACSSQVQFLKSNHPFSVQHTSIIRCRIVVVHNCRCYRNANWNKYVHLTPFRSFFDCKLQYSRFLIRKSLYFCITASHIGRFGLCCLSEYSFASFIVTETSRIEKCSKDSFFIRRFNMPAICVTFALFRSPSTIIQTFWFEHSCIICVLKLCRISIINHTRI